jgi:hypothetical protein
MNIEKQTIIDKVNELNQKLEQLGIPQLRYVFDKEFEVVQLFYTCDYYTDWVGSVVDVTPSEILDWLKVQESQFYLYKQLISYFGSGFAHAIIPNDSSVELTLKHLTYYFKYDEDNLVVIAYKHYVGKDLTKHGSKVGDLQLERVGLPHSRNALATKVSITRTLSDSELIRFLDCIQDTFTEFERTLGLSEGN